MSKAWWYGRPLRIYHPNAREFELQDLDVRKFISQCAETKAEAVVISAGGIYAFYPSKVPYHYVSPVIKGKDLLAEIVKEANERELYVIARVDFSKAREDAYQEHPEWFQRQPDGKPHRSGKYYFTCPIASYQNEAFAIPVIQELLKDYNVDGFHLNAGGFHGYCYCASCAASFGEPIPENPEENPGAWRRFLRWRETAVAEQQENLYKTMQEIKPDAFYMAEMPGIEHVQWKLRSGWYTPALVDSFSHQLYTSGGVGDARKSRWWIGLSADQANAVSSKPLINIKMQMREMRITETFMPMAEFYFNAYQSLAHGAGLKLATFGIPQNLQDPRAFPAIAEVFSFMSKQQEVLDSMTSVSNVALIWPEWALLQGYALEGESTEHLRGEVAGLYNALKGRHIQTDLLYDEHIEESALKRFDAVVLPTAAWLNDGQVDALLSYASGGGRVVLMDSSSTLPLPRKLADLLGGGQIEEAGKGAYALSEIDQAPPQLQQIGPIPLLRPYRKIAPEGNAAVWMYNTISVDPAVPEEFGLIQAGPDPIVASVAIGDGSMVYCATGLGQLFQDIGHADYVRVLETMITHDSGKTNPVRTNAPGTVEVSLARWKRGMVVHLVNITGPAPLDEVIPIGPFDLDIEWNGSAAACLCAPNADDVELSCDVTGGRLKITVPRIQSYAQIVVTNGN